MAPFSFSASSFSTLDTSSGIENLSPQVNRIAPCTLSAAYNVRFTEEGGVRNRDGITQMVDLATSAKVDDGCTLKKYEVSFWKSGTGIYIATRAQLEAGNAYTIGVTRTASEKDFLFPHDSDVYATNTTDSYLRIAVAKATVAIADTDVTITVDDIGQFASGGGNVYINGDVIAYTGVSGSTLTGVTGIQTGGHAINSIVTQTTTISGAPKGYCIGEIEGSALVGKGPLLYGSLPSTDQNPEYFYDFTVASGATIKRLSGDIKCIVSGLRVGLIGMISGMDVTDGFDPTTGAIITFPLSRVHGVPNNRCIVEFDNKFAVLTNEGRILIAMQGQTGFELLDSPDKRQNFDYPVAGYIKENKDSLDNSVNFLHYNPATKILKATILMSTGITEDIVCQTDIGAWSIDSSKNIRCRLNLQECEFAGDDSDDKIHKDEYGFTDNGSSIISRITTGKLRLGRKGVTGDYLNLVYGGVLSENGQFYQRIIHNDVIDEELILAEDMVANGQMTISETVSFGEGEMGNEQLGGPGSETDVFPFNFPYEMMFDAESVQLEWEISDDGAKAEFRYFDISGETDDELLINVT